LTARSSPIEAAKSRHRLGEVAARTGITIGGGPGRLRTVRCPLPSHGHWDRTPSMRLDIEADRWWCFACSLTNPDGSPMSGDVIDWVSQTEQVDWKAAIDILDSGRVLTNAWASATGNTRPLGRPAVETTWQSEPPDLARTTSERVQTALETAWTFYTARDLHRRGSAYLAGRGIHDVECLERHNRRFEVGHTPDHPTGLVDWMRRQSFTGDELVDAGLAHRRSRDKHLNDFYRDRVLIPVRDRINDLTGFIGRNVGDPRWPKYKNPPHTVRYDKSVHLYQPLPARDQTNGQVIVVEGVIDAIAIAVAAIRIGRSDWYCPITQSGRELSTRQLRYVLNLHDQPPVIAMDGDEPGRSSNRRLAAAAASRGRQVIVAQLPDGEDPASWLTRKGPAGLTTFDRASLVWPTPEGGPCPNVAADSPERTAGIRLIRTITDQHSPRFEDRAGGVGQSAYRRAEPRI
jgi:DNA primase catalytic core